MANVASTDELLLELELRGSDKLHIRKIVTNKGDIKVDIRKMYTDDKGELQFGKQGIRFDAEMLSEIMQALVPVLEADEVEDLQKLCEDELSIEDDETDESAE